VSILLCLASLVVICFPPDLDRHSSAEGKVLAVLVWLVLLFGLAGLAVAVDRGGRC
jgi:hypothetical protein